MGKPSSTNTVRAWQRMLSGRRLDLLDPSPLDIEIEDIAHGLAFVARWNGQTEGEFAYSVAEHSILVEELYSLTVAKPEPRWQLAALLHDAPEYVIGDMISPVKAAVGPGYKAMDDRLARAVHIRFGLPSEIPSNVKKAIKKVDRLSAWFEATQIAGFAVEEADKFFGSPPDNSFLYQKISPRPPMEVKSAFLARFEELSRDVS